MGNILYSFRRCPYAMRARLAIQAAGVTCELREIVLRDKAPEFLAASPKGTVPVVIADGVVIEESFDVMLWALRQNDPQDWLDMPDAGYDLIKTSDGPFKANLDRTKYASRYPDMDVSEARNGASEFLHQLDKQLTGQTWLYGDRPCLADFAILPFVRQFANIDRDWFNAQGWDHLIGWLDRFLTSDAFASIMTKYPKWVAGDTPTQFPS